MNEILDTCVDNAHTAIVDGHPVGTIVPSGNGVMALGCRAVGAAGRGRAKPPVGALLLLQAYQLLRRKSILEDASSFFPTSRRRSRSLSLDTGDREYEQEGGVHFVRAELYRVLLADAIARGVARGVAREPRGVPAGAATAPLDPVLLFANRAQADSAGWEGQG